MYETPEQRYERAEFFGALAESTEPQKSYPELARYVNENGRLFIGGLRLSFSPGLTAIGFAKRGIEPRHIADKEVRLLYQKWKNMDNHELSVALTEHMSDDDISSYAQQYDPITGLVLLIEEQRAVHFPDEFKESRSSTLLICYEGLINTVHGLKTQPDQNFSSSHMTAA